MKLIFFLFFVIGCRLFTAVYTLSKGTPRTFMAETELLELKFLWGLESPLLTNIVEMGKSTLLSWVMVRQTKSAFANKNSGNGKVNIALMGDGAANQVSLCSWIDCKLKGQHCCHG